MRFHRELRRAALWLALGFAVLLFGTRERRRPRKLRNPRAFQSTISSPSANAVAAISETRTE